MTKKVENKIFLIYKFTNKINGKSYIGFTCRGFELRMYEHVYLSTKKSNFKFHQALKKYGIDNFNYEILENNILSRADANIREIYYIELFNTFRNGYNMTKGGSYQSEYILTETSREKMRNAKLGTTQSFETKTKRSKSLKGVPKSEQHKINSGNALKGKRRSDETKINISQSRTGKCLGSENPSANKINIYDSDKNLKFKCNGNFDSLCKEFKLPLHALRNSYYNNGKPIYTYKFMKQEVLSKYGEYIGWTAIKL